MRVCRGCRTVADGRTLLMKIRTRYLLVVLVVAVVALILLLHLASERSRDRMYQDTEDWPMRRHIRLASTPPTTAKHPRQRLFGNRSTPVPIALPDLDSLTDEMTVVTGYFNLGSFNKGSKDYFTPDLYRRWMTVFSRINNSVVAYFDSDDDIAYFAIVRSSFPSDMTRITLVTRKTMWAFGLEPYIQRIFETSKYPYNPPNTEMASYSSAMHAKYELMRRTIVENPFRTKYVCWLDVGLFRDLVPSNVSPSVPSGPSFELYLPRGLNDFRVGYSQVYRRNPFLQSTRDVIMHNAVWVCGCFFVSRVDTMYVWTAEYMRAVELMIDEGDMSTDQQVIYWLFNSRPFDPQTLIQAYGTGDLRKRWFHLGYLAKEAGESRIRNVDLLFTQSHLVDLRSRSVDPRSRSVDPRSRSVELGQHVLRRPGQ